MFDVLLGLFAYSISGFCGNILRPFFMVKVSIELAVASLWVPSSPNLFVLGILTIL
jgi:hypothetical protein